MVDDPADFYSNRVPKKQRKQTLGEELMSEAGLEEYVDRRTALLKVRFRWNMCLAVFQLFEFLQEKEAKLKAIRSKKNAAKKRKPIKRGK